MYSVLGLGSVCLSGVGVYFCVNNVKRVDVESCFKKIDEKVTIFENKVLELANKAGIQFDILIENIRNEFDNSEVSTIEEELELKVSCESTIELELTHSDSTQDSDSAQSTSEKTLEDFIFLNQESEDESQKLLP